MHGATVKVINIGYWEGKALKFNDMIKNGK
jgi:uncharacterized membrane protein YwzB